MIRYTKAYIKNLLDKYMDGTSTLEEEDILAEYFRGKDIPQEWEDYRQLFQEMEAMKPQPKARKRWIGWSIAAAVVVAGVLYLSIPSEPYDHPCVPPVYAEADTTTMQKETHPQAEQTSDTISSEKEIPQKKRSLRKPAPTLTDYDKAYALMAATKQELQETERQMAQCQQEIIEAHLAAYGYIPVMQEDGTIIYMNEQTNYIAYEE